MKAPLTDKEREVLKWIDKECWGDLQPDDFEFNKYSRRIYNSLVKKGHLKTYGGGYIIN